MGGRPNSHPLIKALREARKEAGLRDVDIAAALNITPRAFTYWEKQQRTPNFLTFVDWANAVGYDVKLEKRP